MKQSRALRTQARAELKLRRLVRLPSRVAVMPLRHHLRLKEPAVTMQPVKLLQSSVRCNTYNR